VDCSFGVVLGVSPNYQIHFLLQALLELNQNYLQSGSLLLLMYKVWLQNLSAAMRSGAIGTIGRMFDKHMMANSSSFYSAYACPAKPGDARMDHSIKYNQLAGIGNKGDLQVTLLATAKSLVERKK
jgi:hypothetical protein